MDSPEPRRNPVWDPLGLWQLARPVARPVAGVPGTALQTVVAALRSQLVGRRVGVRTGGETVRLTVSGFDADLDPIALPVGQWGRVVLAAEDVAWRDQRFAAARAVLHNAHSRPGVRPELVAAPVDLVVTLDAARVSELVDAQQHRFSVDITEADEVLVRWRRHPDWGSVEVLPVAEGSRIRLRPVALTVRGRRRPVNRPFPPIGVDLRLADGVRVRRIVVGEQRLEVHLRFDEWRLPGPDLDGLLRGLLSPGSVLDLAGLAVRGLSGHPPPSPPGGRPS